MDRWWMIVWLVAGCTQTPALGTGSGGDATSTTDGDTTSDPVAPPSTVTTSTSGTSTTSTTSAAADITGADPTSAFITRHDGGSQPSFECDLFEQDCDRGDESKCMPWANDGGPAWNATRCVPVVPDPAGVGETCTVQGSAVSGFDDCDLGTMCWDVGPDLVGECIQICGGTARAPTCPEGTTCSQNSAATIVICEPVCDPLAADCGDEVCVSVNDQFWCIDDQSPPATAHGDTCQYLNECPDGLACIPADNHSACAAGSCCSTFCDLTAGEDPCPLLDPGQSCQPWFVPGMAPAGYDDLGICTVAR